MPHQDWLRRVFDVYESKLVHYAWSIVGDMEAARDIAQDTFLKLCRETPATVGDPPNAWLYKICRNRAIDHYRRRQRHVTVSVEQAGADLPDTCAAADAELIHAEQHADILTALSALPEREQEIVRLKFLHDFSYQQIAATVGLSVSNVGYILHHALIKMREQVADSDKFSTQRRKDAKKENENPLRSLLLCVFALKNLTGASI